MQRRTFLRSSLAAGTAGVAVAAGLLTPQAVFAAWPKAAFDAKDVKSAMSAIAGGDAPASGDIKIKAPDIAENGAVVPVTVSTGIAGVESISIFAAKNGTPLTSSFQLGEGTEAYISTRIKMGKTSDVIALVKAGGKLYSSKKAVKVTIGGCGG
ncbi:MAG TPA: thiosulfate oxidation carrier protein SoxY [Gammaproteobacteria bacterium]|nr:thiosulfate oxidation carrier protein SoxY [Gammaproteobacteria bacterium]